MFCLSSDEMGKWGEPALVSPLEKVIAIYV